MGYCLFFPILELAPDFKGWYLISIINFAKILLETYQFYIFLPCPIQIAKWNGTHEEHNLVCKLCPDKFKKSGTNAWPSNVVQ